MKAGLTVGRPGWWRNAWAACCGVWLLAGQATGAEPYTFETLVSDASLAGQDGWQAESGGGDATIVLDASGNGTQVARHVDTFVTQLTAEFTRTNDAVFDFLPFEGTETKAVIQFEATGEHMAMLALGCDLNGDGLLRAGDGELGPGFGVADRYLTIQEVNLGTVYQDNFNQGGGDGNSGNDWYRLQLRMDFTANAGDGTGSLYFKNLSQGDHSFHTVSGMVNRPLGLSGLAVEAGPSRWNAMHIRLLSNGNSVPSMDNIIPNGTTLRITSVVRAEDLLEITWRGGIGPYQVQQSDNLGVTPWTDVGDPVEGTFVEVPVAVPRIFYRISQP